MLKAKKFYNLEVEIKSEYFNFKSQLLIKKIVIVPNPNP